MFDETNCLHQIDENKPIAGLIETSCEQRRFPNSHLNQSNT